VDGNLICVGPNGFPSVGCRGFAVSEGKWYYECTLLSAGCIQVGWADCSFTGNSDQGQGVGDDAHSWAFDGWRVCVWHEISADWGCKWDVGDVVGCAVDMDTREMSFYLNGYGLEVDMGLAFRDFNFLGGLYPCASLSRRESVQFNFGSTSFRHLPPDGFSPYINHVNSCLSEFKATVSISESSSSMLLKLYKAWPFAIGASVKQSATQGLIIDDSFEECKEVRELDWRKRYFLPDESKSTSGGNRNSLQNADNTASFQVPSAFDKLLAEFTSVSQDLQTLYCRMAFLRIINSVSAVPNDLLVPFLEKLLERNQPQSSGFEGFLILLRVVSLTTSRTRAYRAIVGSIPRHGPVPHHVGDMLCAGGAPVLYGFTASLKTILRTCRMSGLNCEFVVNCLLESIKIDTLASAQRDLSNSWKQDGFVPTLVLGRMNTGSVNEMISIPSLTLAVWTTNLVLDFLADGMNDSDKVHASCYNEWDSVYETLSRLITFWVASLKSPNVAVKTCACRMVSMVLQEFTVASPGSRFAHAPSDLLPRLASIVPVGKVNALVYSRLLAERAALPVVSEMLQALLELLLAASQIPNALSTPSQGVQSELTKRNEYLWGEIDEQDPGYDWESISGRLMSENGWITWTGSVKQLAVDHIPHFEKRTAPDRQYEPPELMPGCKVSMALSSSSTGDSDPEVIQPAAPRPARRSTSAGSTDSSPAPAGNNSKLSPNERVGTVLKIVNWDIDDPVPGMARLIRWDDDGTEQTVRWGADNAYDVTHLKAKEGSIVGKYPAPSKRSHLMYVNSFGLDATFGVILRIREASITSAERDTLQGTYGFDLPSNRLLGLMEWPDFGAVVQVSGLAWADGRWTLTEEFLLQGTSHAPWSIRFGHSHWRSGTTYDLNPTRDSANDATDRYSGHMVGGFNYTVSTAAGKAMVVGDIFLQRSRLFSFDEQCKGPRCNVVLDGTTVAKANEGGQTCVYGNIGFSSGVHYWELKIEQGDIGSIFLGVAEKPFPPGTPASAYAQRLSRWSGIGFCGNRVSLRSGTNGAGDRLTSYGENFHSGDVVGVLLDMNRGRLSFFLDGLKYGEHTMTDLGEAFDQLGSPTAARPRTLFPIVGLQKSMDRVTITPRWLSTVSIPVEDDLCMVGKAWRLLTCWSLERQTSTPFKEDLWTYRAGWRDWLRLNAGRYVRVKTRCKSLGMQLVLDTNPIACVEASIRLGLPKALFRGDRILFNLASGRKLDIPEEAIILGAYNGQLWYRLESQHGDVASVESGSPAWSLAPYDVDGFTLLRRGYRGQDKFPVMIADLILPRVPPYHGGLLYLSHSGGAVMRTGIEIDSSDMICTTPPFITVYATERRVNSSNIARYKVFYDGKYGWISERMRGGSEEMMLSRIKSATEGEIAEAQRTVIEAAVAANMNPQAIIREDVKSLAEALERWERRVTDAGYGHLVASWQAGQISPKPTENRGLDRYMELASTMDGVKNWSVEADMQLAELISRTATKLGVSPQNVTKETIITSLKTMESPASLLYQINVDRAVARVALLRVANQVFAHTMPYLSACVPEEKLCKDITGHDSAIDIVPAFKLPSPGGHASLKESVQWSPPCSARRLRSLRRVMFFQTKNAFWESILDATSTPTALPQDEYEDPREIKTIKLNRIKANNVRNAAASLTTSAGSSGGGSTSSSSSEKFNLTVFGQLYKELRNWTSSSFRRGYLGKGHGGQKRAFKVKFLGEGVNDYGGPYRAVFEQIVDELQTYASVGGRKISETCLLPLLIPCANRASSLGANQDKYVLSPSSTTPSVQEYMNFFGKLVGTAVRHNLSLALDLSALVWRPLARMPVSLPQLDSVDTLAAKAMESIYAAGSELENKEKLINGQEKNSTPLEWADYSFTVNFPDGSRLPLVPGGETKSVTLRNWRLYLNLAEAARLKESEVLYKSFRDGLSQVLPAELLPIFTASELEQLITGSSKVDIGLLKQCTEYENVNPESTHIHNFWEVIEEMSDEEKTMFLRFVWARSRMPSTLESLPMNFKIQGPQGPARESPDDYLPSAQTCFFSLSLPPYSSKEVLRAKLLYAIQNSPNMDADVRLHSGEGWAET
jgi:hypothetical protein